MLGCIALDSDAELKAVSKSSDAGKTYELPDEHAEVSTVLTESAQHTRPWARASISAREKAGPAQLALRLLLAMPERRIGLTPSSAAQPVAPVRTPASSGWPYRFSSARLIAPAAWRLHLQRNHQSL